MNLTTSELMGNISWIYQQYGRNNVNTDKKLLLLYWRDINGISMTKDQFDTKAWLELAEDPITVIHGKMMLEAIWESERNAAK